MAIPKDYVCPYCAGKFPYTYWGATGRWGGFGTVKKPGLAKSNFKKHVRACRRKQSMIGKKMYRLGRMNTGFIIREYEVVKETPKYLWISPENVPKEFSKKIKRGDGRFKRTKSELISAAIRERLAKIKKEKSAIQIAKEEIEDLNNIGR